MDKIEVASPISIKVTPGPLQPAPQILSLKSLYAKLDKQKSDMAKTQDLITQAEALGVIQDLPVNNQADVQI